MKLEQLVDFWRDAAAGWDRAAVALFRRAVRAPNGGLRQRFFWAASAVCVAMAQRVDDDCDRRIIFAAKCERRGLELCGAGDEELRS